MWLVLAYEISDCDQSRDLQSTEELGLLCLLLLEPCNTRYRRRQWHPTPVLLPGESHGWRSLVGCSPWGRWESDTTERLPFHFSLSCIGEGNGSSLQCSCLENPRVGEPGGLPSMGSHRVRYDWSDLAAAAATPSMWTSPDKPIQWSDIGWWETHSQCLWITRQPPAKQVSKALEH